jgi:hypothetical protein
VFVQPSLYLTDSLLSLVQVVSGRHLVWLLRLPGTCENCPESHVVRKYFGYMTNGIMMHENADISTAVQRQN